jgi:hypothetical protein
MGHAKGVLAAFEMAVAPTTILHLPRFATAYDQGKAVTELKPAGVVKLRSRLVARLDKSSPFHSSEDLDLRAPGSMTYRAPALFAAGVSLEY